MGFLTEILKRKGDLEEAANDCRSTVPNTKGGENDRVL